MFNTVVNTSKVFGKLKLRENSKVRRSQLGHSNNHHYVLFWQNGAAIQSGKCIVFTHIANFKSHSHKVGTWNTNEAARTLFTNRCGTRPLHLAGGQAGLASRRLETESPYSYPILILMYDPGTFLPLPPPSPTCKMKDIYYFLKQLQVLHRHHFSW